jgi:hypothetical protein
MAAGGPAGAGFGSDGGSDEGVFPGFSEGQLSCQDLLARKNLPHPLEARGLNWRHYISQTQP